MPSPSAVTCRKKTDLPQNGRIDLLDTLRGSAMIFVMLYHLLYDLRFIYNIRLPRLITPGESIPEAVHIFFLWILFAVSGICTGYSRNPSKRGAALYLTGWIITAATSVIMPSQLIVFGVLSCFGACMVITDLLKPLLKRIPWQALGAVSFVLWLCFSDFYKSGTINLLFAKIPLPIPVNSQWLYPLGLRFAGFKSADYFPLIPYIFMFLTGYALHTPINERKLPDWFYREREGIVGFIGRHSLIFYAVHQPIFFFILEMILKR